MEPINKHHHRWENVSFTINSPNGDVSKYKCECGSKMEIIEPNGLGISEMGLLFKSETIMELLGKLMV